MTWERKPAIKGAMGPCLCCGVAASFFPPDGLIAVGFGYAGLECDGQNLYAEDSRDDNARIMTGEEAERIAANGPDADYRIVLHGPLRSRVYQRHAPGQWALIEQGEGFA